MIELTLVQGHGFVFRSSDARVLREEHRIVGMLIGSLPAHPHQNIHLGLPLQLSKEEVSLLLDLGLAEFKRKNNYPGHFASSEASVHKQFMDQSLAEQIEESKRIRLEEIDSRADKIVEGKLRVRGKKSKKKNLKRKRNGDQDVVKEDEEIPLAVPVDPQQRQEILDDIKSRIPPLTAPSMFVQSHRVNPFVNPDSGENSKPCHCKAVSESSGDTSLDSTSVCGAPPPPPPASPPPPPPPPPLPTTSLPPLPRFESVAWLHPSTARERLKYAAFKHFWSSGLFVTNGVKFGGDFLVYPGDPTRFHSFFVVQCVDYDDEELTPANLVTLARLGTSVKKTLVLASLDEDGELTLTSLEWSHWN